jgi:acyl-coenzyme A thioesterase PaaI-like protein
MSLPLGDLPGNLLITVCDACLQASCWQGIFYCQEFKTAGTIDLSVNRLRKLKREHPCYWDKDPRAVNWRQTGKLK